MGDLEMNKKVFIIAEIGCNFEGSIPRAIEMIKAASEAGADAVKFQTFIPEKLASKHAEKFWEIAGCPGETQLEEFKQMPHLNYEQYNELSNVAKKENIIFFSSPEDETSADLLESLNVPLYKISSMNITHIPLLKHVALKKKPMIISSGASTIGEIEEAIRVIKEEGCDDVSVLHCITNYPTKDEDVNLKMISHLKKVFPTIPIGYSDHTLPENGEGILAAAVIIGATIIEKHFTFDIKRPGYDHAISADYKGLKRIVSQIRRVEKAIGNEFKKPIDSEMLARIQARRSIVLAKDISKNTIITKDMLEIKRPATGIEPKFLDIVIGRKTKTDIPEDTVLKWEMI